MTPALLDARVVLRRGDFALDVRVAGAAGEVVGILGPNGAGKTTLLRTLAGLERCSAGGGGFVRLGGATLDEADVFVPADRRPVGVVFQDYRLFPHLDVRGNVAFAARAGGQRRREARAAATPWLERVGLLALADRRPAQLSGGQAQRVALARALASRPSLLLLDEPLAALDARTRLEVRGDLRGHLTSFAGPTLLVTHDPLEAMVLADRLLVVEDGRVVQEGTPAQVARRPGSDYVARLVGLNLYPGVAPPAGEPAAALRVELDGGGVLWAAHPSVPVGGRVLVALRPGAIALHLADPGPGSPRNVWTGVVAGLELLQDRVRVQVDGRPGALVDLTPAAVAELTLRPGTPVWLSAKATEAEAYPRG